MWTLLGILVASALAPNAAGQSPMPEEGATLIPHGAFLSYNSLLVTSHRTPGPATNSPALL
jgi:hypothetical protein